MWGGIAMAGASLLGGAMGNSARRREANKDRSWQENMSGTARQREVQDLEKAGLNRVLAAGGQGASTPSGAMAQQQNPMEGVGQAFSSSAQAFMAKKKLSSEIGLIDAQKNKTSAEAKIATDAGEKSSVQSNLWNKAKKIINYGERFGATTSKQYKNYHNKAVQSEKARSKKSNVKPQQINPRFKSNRSW